MTANKAIREHHSCLSQLEIGRHIPITGVYAQQSTMAFDPHHIARLHNARMALGDDNHRALRTLGAATQRLGQHPIHRLPSDRFHQKTNRLRHGPDGATIRVFGDADDLRDPVPREQSPRSGVVGCASIADHTAIYDHDIERTRFHMTEPLEFPNDPKHRTSHSPAYDPSPVIFRPNHFRFNHAFPIPPPNRHNRTVIRHNRTTIPPFGPSPHPDARYEQGRTSHSMASAISHPASDARPAIPSQLPPGYNIPAHSAHGRHHMFTRSPTGRHARTLQCG